MSTIRPNAANMKVISLGLSRTGTSSMRVALEMLGFGPCYDPLLGVASNDLPTWTKIGDGNGTPEDLDNILRGYSSIVDVPGAMYGAELLTAYPDAKFILTTRDPVKWETSLKVSVLPMLDAIRKGPSAHDLGERGVMTLNWLESHWIDGYHGGRLRSNTQQELLDHNQRVKEMIPSEKLLVYELGEGWDRLVDFLEVSKPNEPFPHINNAAQFKEDFLDKYKITVAEDGW